MGLGVGDFVKFHGCDLWALVKGSGEDKLCWRLEKKKRFTISGYHWVLLGSIFSLEKYMETQDSF